MKADTLLTTNSTPKRPSKDIAAEAVPTPAHGPLSGPGPWFRMNGVWYTKDAAGEIVPMETQATKTRNRRVKPVDVKSRINPLT